MTRTEKIDADVAAMLDELRAELAAMVERNNQHLLRVERGGIGIDSEFVQAQNTTWQSVADPQRANVRLSPFECRSDGSGRSSV